MPKRFIKKDFIERAKKVHGDKFDYSKVEYVNSNTKVCIICPIHGEFWQRPADHIRGVGCRLCYGNEKMTKETFIEKAIMVHGNKYDYSKVEYNGNKTKVCIICPIHGEFWQRPNDHLSGYACPYCGNNLKKTTKQFISEARKIHEDKYDYSKVEYIKAHAKVCIICPIHGEFWQTPQNHLHGANCPYCNCGNKSKMEDNIRNELKYNKINFEQQKTFDWLKYKKNLFLDFYCDEHKLAIEVQGDQHYVSVKRFGGQEDFKLRKDRDRVKKMLCEEHGIKMFYITKKNYSLGEVLKYINETSNKKK
jgi:very-short-patch-repair endonuclease